ncbi:RNA polymerase sigma factor [Streptomyces flavalbus]
MKLSLRARVRAGDPDAFGQLFDAHAPAVHRHAVRLTGDWVVADDIVSLTFLEAWRLRERVLLEGDLPRRDVPGGDVPGGDLSRRDVPGGDASNGDEESLRPWLLGIATNVTRNTTRAARRHQAALSRIPPPDPVPDFAEEVTRRLADTEELAAAHRALRRMRRGEREVFALCVWEGLDSATAAQALGVAVGTVRARLSRARKRLRKLTEQELERGGDGRGPGGIRRAEGGIEQRAVQRPAPVGQSLGSRHQAARSPQEKKR